MKSISTTLIELPATADGKLYGKLSDDIYSIFRLPSRATDLLAAIAINAGFNDTIAINPSFNKTRGRFTLPQMKRIVTSDVVGISTITRTAPQSYELADYIRRANPKTKIIFGGPHASALPEEALLYGDIVITNEGDHTFVELLNHIARGTDMKDMAGIVFKNENNEIVRTPKRPFLTNEELSSLPFPTFSKDVLDGITHIVVNTSRGCPYACEYCAVIENFGREFRFLDIERTIELIQHTLAQTQKTIFFGDDNFAASPKRAKTLLEEILKRGIKMPQWLAQVRVESAGDKELLKLMKRAGCGRVCIGFESINEETLKLFNKHSSLEKNTLAIKRFHEAKISIHGMFIIGADTDTKETIKETVEYAKKNRIDTAQFTLLVPLPGTKTTTKLEAAGRVISHDWHLYDGHHILVQPKTIPAHELYQLSSAAWLEFYSVKEGIKHLFYGNDHWFNFLVRIWGAKLAQKFIEENSYYRKALASLDEWIDKRTGEYDLWMAKFDSLASDAKINIEERRKAAKLEVERIISTLSEKRRNIDDYFAPYKQKFLKEIEARLQQRLVELGLLPYPSPA
jgi:radical SAM superfamily enzyme YgiQ (UPF0313 family)